VIEPEMCSYCFRPPITEIRLNRGPLRVLLNLPNKVRPVCLRHIPRDSRPGGRHG
jgi:hypothetical protein